MAQVSIIMPCHNSEKTIREAIESVISQTFIDWELLVIDDCSNDGTVQIVSGFIQKDKRIKLLKTEKSYGKPFYPRNIGIQNASARFIAFLDSDDIWMPTKLMRQIPLFDKENIAIVFSEYEKFSSTNYQEKKYKKIRKNDCQFQKRLYFCTRKAKQ